jgi:glycosyltransferase involved in cell wall biosynthesis/sulfatase maturation enzyme AslB (radical SAM superfamily)
MKQSNPFFSIIITAYNSEVYIHNAIESVLLKQSISKDLYEVIVVDDCSTDATEEIVLKYNSHSNFQMISTSENSGPGIARNIGVDIACGQWVIFLDSDDYLMPDALLEIYKTITNHESSGDFDIVGFNWSYAKNNSDIALQAQGLRKDHFYLMGKKEDFIKRYLSLQMDGSVIFNAFKRNLIIENKLKFEPGFHEDVDYLFFCYWYSKGFLFADRILYAKVHRQDSIVNTISEKHIMGFFRAWRCIGDFIAVNEGYESKKLKNYFVKGLIAVVATRLRATYQLRNNVILSKLYQYLFNNIETIIIHLKLEKDFGNLKLFTKYGIIVNSFIDIMSNHELSQNQKTQKVINYLDANLKKSWSCFDIHHSVFLAPNQIRTCCKRFFHNGSMRGDVVLLDVEGRNKSITSEEIVMAKRDLYDAINRGDSTDCDGCPFLEFKEWQPIEPLNIKYLSLEYHSVCNLRCNYCSETYYGGAKANYNVYSLISEFLNRGQLEKCENVVWGGGEPILAADFSILIERLVDKLPTATHRVLTNSVKFSQTIAKLLEQNLISVTTSIDAGSPEIFKIVRGRDSLHSVMSNLKKYVDSQPRRVTAKYIFTDENSDIMEVEQFVQLINYYEIQNCNFQISSNFKDEKIELNSLILMIAMYGLLMQSGFTTIFLDDLLRHRLTDAYQESIYRNEIITKLRDIGIENTIADPLEYPEVVVWGAGWQAKYLLQESMFFKQAKIAFFVDDTPEKIGNHHLGHKILSPSVLENSNLPIIIAAVQGYPFIYDALLRLGIPEFRVINKLVI